MIIVTDKNSFVVRFYFINTISFAKSEVFVFKSLLSAESQLVLDITCTNMIHSSS